VLFSVLVEVVEVLALRGWREGGTFLLVSRRLDLVEPEASGFEPLAGVVVLEFGVLKGFVGTGGFTFADPLPFASFAHVLPQYGYTVVPSSYCGFLLQCLKTRTIQQSPKSQSERAHSQYTAKVQGLAPCSRSRSHPPSYSDLRRY